MDTCAVRYGINHSLGREGEIRRRPAFTSRFGCAQNGPGDKEDGTFVGSNAPRRVEQRRGETNSSRMQMLGSSSCLVLLQLLAAPPEQPPRRSSSPPTPITDPRKFPAQQHCSRCGLCETSFVVNVTQACAFLPTLGMARLDALEPKVHGRSRRYSIRNPPIDREDDVKNNADDDDDDEARFGVLLRPIQLARGRNIAQAQWTGVVTSIATALLESGAVDAVACIAAAAGNDDDDSDGSTTSTGWNNRPRPILARTVADVYQARGVKPSLAPSLAVLDEIIRTANPPVRKLLFCGVGCAVQAFRTIQDDLGLENVYVLGTNCADNSPTPEAATQFIEQGLGIPTATVAGYEFMPDYRVHVKQTNGSYVKRPYFSLPGNIAETAIAKSCLTCMDYTNGLADVVVGYMGAPMTGAMNQNYQTLSVRNQRGAFMVDTAIARNRLEISLDNAGRSGRFVADLVGATLESDPLVGRMIGQAPATTGMPVWLGDILATILTRTGPKGLNFAKYSIDYHILRNYFYILHESSSLSSSGGPTITTKPDVAVPSFAQAIIDHYRSTNKNVARLEELIWARRTR
jgi:coenzyme F420-reducing hydrogenase beta subunit